MKSILNQLRIRVTGIVENKLTISRKLIFLIVAMFPFLLNAQTTWKFNSGLKSGYERNVFQNPGATEGEEEGESEAEEEGEEEEGEEGEENLEFDKGNLLSAAFLQLDGSFNLKYKADKHVLRWNTDMRGTAFPGLGEANQLYGSTELRHEYAVNSKLKLINGAEFTVLRGASASLRTGPYRFLFSYYKVELKSGIRIQRSKKHTLQFLASYRSKHYETASDAPYFYHAIGIEGRSSHLLVKNSGKRQKLIFTFSLKDRIYSGGISGLPEEGEFEIADSTEGRNRNWLYSNTKGEYLLLLHKKWSFKPYMSLRSRHDISGGGFGYGEAKLGFKSGFQSERFRAGLDASYAYRIYPKISLDGEEEGGNLSYQITKISGELAFNLGGGIWLNSGAALVNRNANNPSTSSLSRRSYLNYQVFAGLTFELKGKRNRR